MSCARTDCHFCRKMGSKQRRHRALQVFFLLALRSPHEMAYPNPFPGFAVYCHWSFTALQLRCRSAHINSSKNKKNIQCRIDIDRLFAYMYDWYNFVLVWVYRAASQDWPSEESAQSEILTLQRRTKPLGSKRGKGLKKSGPSLFFLARSCLGQSPGGSPSVSEYKHS